MRGSWPWKFVAIAATLILSPCALYADTLQPVTQERLLQEPANDWLMYGGNYAGWRFSPLKDIDRQNVKKLQATWIFQTGVPAQMQASPVVADGVMYLTAAYNKLFALDAATGKPLLEIRS